MALRKLSSIAFRLLLAIACFAFTACFDTHEEVWIHPDGSARAEFRYHIPKSATFALGGEDGLRKRIQDLVATQPELRLDDLTIQSTDAGVEIAAKLSTDSLLWLRDIKKNGAISQMPESATDIAGKFKVTMQMLKVDFNRTTDIGRALGFAKMAISDDERQQRKLCAIVHLPLPAVESNATRTEDGGRTLIWETSLGDALKGPTLTHFRAPVPLPRWLVPTVIAAILALVAGLVTLTLRWKKRRHLCSPSVSTPLL